VPYLVWSRAFGGEGWDGAKALAMNEQGEVYVGGYFKSASLDMGGAPLINAGPANHSDVFVAKYDSLGNHLWSKRFGGASLDELTDVELDSKGNLFVAGKFMSSIDFGGGDLQTYGETDFFVTKLDGDGEHIWSEHFGTSSSDAGTIILAIDSQDDLYVGGSHVSSNPSLDFGGGALQEFGGSDVFVVKLDSSGQHIWSKSFGGTSGEDISGIFADSSVFLAGGFYSSSISFGGPDLQETGGHDYYMVKLYASSGHAWSESSGGAAGSSDVSVDTNGNVYNARENPYDSLRKLNASGNEVWSKNYQNLWGDFSVWSADGGHVYIFGGFKESGTDLGGGPLQSNGSHDMFVGKLDSEGNHVWSSSYGGVSVDYSYAPVRALEDGPVAIAGAFASSTINFGGELHNNQGSCDVFVAVLGQ